MVIGWQSDTQPTHCPVETHTRILDLSVYLNYLVKALDSVSEWANNYVAAENCHQQMRCSSYLCTLPANDCPYSLCNMPLQWSVSTKDLGVTMDNGLVFDQHIAHIVHTASTRVYLILRSFFLEIMKSLSKPMLPMYDPSWNTVLLFGLHIVLT